MIAELGLRRDRPIADCYRHYGTGEWAVVEFKGGLHLKRAIEQLQSTVEQLLAQARRVDYVIAVMEKLRQPESSLYRIKHSTREVYFRNSENRRVEIEGLPLFLYYEREVKALGMRDKKWGFT
jgi:hypothetical protein